MIPAWLTEKLSNPPQAGAGVHAYLFSCARQLHAHMSSDEVIATLQSATAGLGRPVPLREIRDAVRNSEACAWQGSAVRGGAASGFTFLPGAVAAPDSAFRWPKPDAVARRCRIADSAADGVAGLADLLEYSPVEPEGCADDWIDRLFPGAEWLCLASDHPATARTRKRDSWLFGADLFGLIVPSPMTGPSGKGLDGRVSHRCLGNTGPRRWLVIEFDSGSLDQQAALHWHLRISAQAAEWPLLTLAVSSGGKSLHGWYGPITSEDSAHELMAYAVSLGADPATWNRCQLVRLPGGSRKVPVPRAHLPEGWPAPGAEMRLEVFYYFPPHSAAAESASREKLASFAAGGLSGASGKTIL